MKRWLIFFSIFTALVVVSFFTFIIINRTRFIQTALSNKTTLSCSIGAISFGFKTQTLTDLQCTLPDQSHLYIKTLTLDLSLPTLISWTLNPFQKNLNTGKWEATDIDFQIVSESSDFSHNGWNSWLQTLPKQTGSVQLHRIQLQKIHAHVAFSESSFEPPVFSSTVFFAREPSSLQTILAEVISTLTEEVSRKLPQKTS